RRRAMVGRLPGPGGARGAPSGGHKRDHLSGAAGAEPGPRPTVRCRAGATVCCGAETTERCQAGTTGTWPGPGPPYVAGSRPRTLPVQAAAPTSVAYDPRRRPLPTSLVATPGRMCTAAVGW